MDTVVVAAKTTSDASKCSPFPPDPNSFASTINTVAREITENGGTATALQVDTRDPANIQDMVDQTMHTYGRIDVVVYNSGAIWWASVEKTPFKRFHLMQSVNAHGVYATVSSVLPEMYKNGGKGEGRIVVISPPIYSRFFRGKTAYAMGKVGMSVLTMGIAVDFEREGREGMAVTSLWPAVVSSREGMLGNERVELINALLLGYRFCCYADSEVISTARRTSQPTQAGDLLGCHLVDHQSAHQRRFGEVLPRRRLSPRT